MILWLTNRAGYSSGMQHILTSALAQHGVTRDKILFDSLHRKVPDLGGYPARKLPAMIHQHAALVALDVAIDQFKPNIIVCNDEATLRCITNQAYTLARVKGSIYRYKELPVIVLDNVSSIHANPTGRFIFQQHLAKVVRYATGQQKRHPAFNYHLCKTVAEVQQHCEAAKLALYVAKDIETAKGRITCTSYTYNTQDGKLVTFEVPFVDPTNEAQDGNYWSREDELLVRMAVAGLNAHPVVKAFQNGTYDSAYEIKELMPSVNYLLDSANMMHSIWCELPKGLHEIASYFLDNYIYWKDENKGVKEDTQGKSRAAQERYWRYNGLDTYYLWLVVAELLAILPKFDWAVRNYNTEFRLSVGPCMAASLRGIRFDAERHRQIMDTQGALAKEGAVDIARFVQEPELECAILA